MSVRNRQLLKDIEDGLKALSDTVRDADDLRAQMVDATFRHRLRHSELRVPQVVAYRQSMTKLADLYAQQAGQIQELLAHAMELDSKEA
jgi:uncharacterized protein YukE